MTNPRFVHRFLVLPALMLPLTLMAKVPVTVSVPPQGYVVQSIGGDRVDVSVMIKPGESPHTFSLSPREMMALGDARVYFKVGHPDFTFERRFLEHIDSGDRDVELVNLAQGVDLQPLPEHDHDHGHEHGETDPHLWVSPRIMRAAGERVAEALIAADPDGESDYRAGLEAFHDQVDALDDTLRSRFEGLDRRRFVVNHPAWGYFARDYDLEQVAIESGGRDPSPQQLARFIDAAADEGVRMIFVQQGFSRRSADTIANEIGAEVLVADPMAADWLNNLDAISEVMAEAMR